MLANYWNLYSCRRAARLTLSFLAFTAAWAVVARAQTEEAASPNSASHGSSVNQAVEWKSSDHVLVHRADADVDINVKNAAVTFKSAVSVPFIFEFENSGVVGGLKRSILHGGRSLTLNGGWKVSSSGRQVLNTADAGRVPGGNGGIVMRACKELLDAMGDAQADATKNGRTFTPVGKGALQDFVRARPL